jgi:hypothetical protein
MKQLHPPVRTAKVKGSYVSEKENLICGEGMLYYEVRKV